LPSCRSSINRQINQALKMYFSQVLALAGAAVAAPLVERNENSVLSNGFIPNPTAAQVKAIELQAHGTIPNIALPAKIADETATVFQLIAANEIFETSFFTSLINNITNKVPGYTDATQNDIDAITAIQAQEEIHALAANAILKTAGRQTIDACQYHYPTTDLKSALAFAATFTDVVLGTLQTALTAFATDGDSEFSQVIGAVIGQEGAQTGYFRQANGHIPSETPFLTVAGPSFALSALSQLVIVPGSCKQTIAGVPVLPALTVSPAPTGTQTIRFTYAGQDADNVSLAYLNQQNVPLVYPITKVDKSNNQVTFTTTFQYDDNLLNGLTIAAIVKGNGPFKTAADVANAAIAGPALIELN